MMLLLPIIGHHSIIYYSYILYYNDKKWLYYKLEIAAQGVAQCEVSVTRVVVDAALRRIGKSRHGGHKSANISRYCELIWKRISPMDSAYFSGRSGGEKIVFRIFF